MAVKPRRYSTVPWLSASDLVPQGDVDTVVELHGGEEIAWGIWIKAPFGTGSDLVMTVHAIKGDGDDGGVITAAVTNAITLQAQPFNPLPLDTVIEGD